MKTKLSSFFIGAGFAVWQQLWCCTKHKLLRISGPAATTITGIRADGSLVWSQRAGRHELYRPDGTSLVGGANWVDYVQLPVTRCRQRQPDH